MRRFLLLTIIALSAATDACAQLRYGIDLGLNLSHLSLSKSVVDTRNRAGFFLGPKLHAKIPKLGLGADVALRYAQKNTAIEVWGQTGSEVYEKEKMSYIEVPLNVRWDINILKALGIFIYTGPQWDWYIGPGTWEGIDHYGVDQFKATFNHHTLSWNVGAGVILFKRLHISVSHSIPITEQGSFLSTAYNTVVQHVEELDMKNYTWQLTLDFYFNK
ncbi:MAG: PorT family protein [Bacteroidaceae bacterium]|nr:PorT family protein [Bacteroidaceae bacterium]